MAFSPNDHDRKAPGAKRSLSALAGFFGLALAVNTVFAASLGMVTDNRTDELRLFDADTGIVLASLQGSAGQISADCALSRDASTGFSSNAGRQISVFRFMDCLLYTSDAADDLQPV